jgi:hypothetical protein
VGKGGKAVKGKGRAKGKSKLKVTGERGPLVISIKVPKKKVPPPNFIEIPVTNLDVMWEKIRLREFLLRFDKLCRLPNRHANTVNDPTLEWNEFLFKSIIVSLIKVVANDTSPIVPYAKEYCSEVEKTPAESPKIWELVREYLEWAGMDPSEATTNNDMEMAQLQLVGKMVDVATSTETIRVTIENDVEQLRYIQKDVNEEIKQLKAAWDEQSLKLTKVQDTMPEQQWKDKFVAMHRQSQAKIKKVEQRYFLQQKKYNQRTQCLGKDALKHHYWHFQQKQSFPDWGSWIICETSEGFVTPNRRFKRPRKPKPRDGDLGASAQDESQLENLTNGLAAPISSTPIKAIPTSIGSTPVQPMENGTGSIACQAEDVIVGRHVGKVEVGSQTRDVTVDSHVGDAGSITVTVGNHTAAVTVGNHGNVTVGSQTVDVTVGSQTGDVTVGSLTGAVTVGNHGNVTVGSQTGDVTVGSQTGDVTVGSQTGDVTVGSQTGDVTVGSQTGDVAVGSQTGDVSVASGAANVTATSQGSALNDSYMNDQSLVSTNISSPLARKSLSENRGHRNNGTVNTQLHRPSGEPVMIAKPAAGNIQHDPTDVIEATLEADAQVTPTISRETGANKADIEGKESELQRPGKKLFYIRGKLELLSLIDWIKSQHGTPDPNLLKELEAYARHMDDD